MRLRALRWFIGLLEALERWWTDRELNRIADRQLRLLADRRLSTDYDPAFAAVLAEEDPRWPNPVRLDEFLERMGSEGDAHAVRERLNTRGVVLREDWPRRQDQEQRIARAARNAELDADLERVARNVSIPFRGIRAPGLVAE